MTAAPRRYLRIWLGLLLLLLCTSATLCLTVDAQDVFKSFRTHDYWIRRSSTERVSKAYAVRARRPDALVLGTSRALHGISVLHPSWTGLRPYNLALSSGHIYEARRYLQHSAALQRPRRILLALDMVMFRTDRNCTEDFDDERLAADDAGNSRAYPLRDLVNLALSPRMALRELWRPLPQRDWAIDPLGESPRAKGRALPPGRKPKIDRLPRAIRWIAGHQYASVHYGGFDSGYRENLREFERVLEIARDNGADIAIVLNPMHASLLWSLQHQGLLQEQDRWSRDIADHVERFNAANHESYPLWNFITVNPATTEPIEGQMPPPPDAHRYFFDPGHFWPALGDRMQDEISGSARGTESLGNRLTTENIAQQLRERDQRLDEWARANPETIRLLLQKE